MNLEDHAERFRKIFPAVESGSAPTPDSIATIERDLGFQIPGELVRFANLCPSYSSWFASIGEDYDNSTHILQVNREFHGFEVNALPQDLVMINHGYDRDCDCYDITNRDEEGRFSICYCGLSENTAVDLPVTKRHISFFLSEYVDQHLSFWEKHRRK